ncbi:hypothetical protein [Rathayibacter iranicus]|uniref:Uncharacterized protein n=2 Tax=Rathayibacter iranicus TaxID=59737 RepID=A0AAD1EN75_9MICO|nr:hypothetical protein [Rathayibacter iranicus]AZZ56430.1 hypothetical protein C7V51_11490 [Rathayibacter iranicus]MWV31808.1 hypothetical protein [Rathayibacter iranicus NCPPB 2253 = VKM Ac-1602]PPI44878.1 hypothetical protein C5E09_10410 [Rathayibacter iranicus]PPI59112.1 hypothetical protein C5E08_11345 [Rathayibacter iranicus]PPI70329.1 hypothetical protein C5E01_10385 [Rathayibacter iranicus]
MEDDELAELQRRAYGRRSDIERDPGALARLHHLEARERRGANEPAPSLLTRDEPTLAQEDAVAPPEDMPSAGGSGAPKRRLLLHLAALAATAALAVGATLVVTSAAEPPGRETAVLPLTSGTDIPGWEDLGFEGSLTTEDFDGLTVVKQRSGGDGGACLYVVRTVDPREGPFHSGCTANSFPAIAQFTVSSVSPEALQERFPVGSALQFILRGEEVHVVSDASTA